MDYLHRETSSARYVLSANDEDYPIAYVQTDGDVSHRDFLSVQNRNDPRPTELVEIGDNPTRAYYLPVNFNSSALDTLINIPQDDQPYLDDAICSGDECPEWSEPICPPIPEEVVVQDTSTVENNAATESSTAQVATAVATTTTEPTTETTTEPTTETTTEPTTETTTGPALTGIDFRFYGSFLALSPEPEEAQYESIGFYNNPSGNVYFVSGSILPILFRFNCASGYIGDVTITAIVRGRNNDYHEASLVSTCP